MKTLITLVRMDLLKAKSLWKMMLFYIVAMAACAISTRVAVLGMGVGLYTILFSVISYDEQSNGTILLGALPVTRKQIVLGKYLFALLLFAAINALLTGVNRIVALFAPPSLNPISIGMLQLLFAVIGLLFIGLLMPLMLYLGPVRGRYWAMGIYMVVFFVSFNFVNGDSTAVLTTLPQNILLFAYPVCMLLLTVSYFIASFLYEKKQFTA